jgi:hypothetical protein
MNFTDWGVGKYMNSPGRHRRADTAATSEPPMNVPEMDRLTEAREALQRAKQQPGRWRKRQRRWAQIASAEHEVQVAAMAAHGAGIGWTQIGDALGIERAQPHTAETRTSGRELRLIRGEADMADGDTPEAQRA